MEYCKRIEFASFSEGPVIRNHGYDLTSMVSTVQVLRISSGNTHASRSSTLEADRKVLELFESYLFSAMYP